MGKDTKQLAGYKSNFQEYYSLGSLKSAIKKSRISIEIKEVVRIGDVLVMSVNIKNNTEDSIMGNAWYDSSGGEGDLDFRDRRIDSFAIPPNHSETFSVKLFLPEALSAKMAEGTFIFKTVHGDEVRVTHILDFS